jgi:hypothetical protein
MQKWITNYRLILYHCMQTFQRKFSIIFYHEELIQIIVLSNRSDSSSKSRIFNESTMMKSAINLESSVDENQVPLINQLKLDPNENFEPIPAQILRKVR